MSEERYKYCNDPVCMDDFITGDCPVEECQLECGCWAIIDSETGDELEIIEMCEECKLLMDYLPEQEVMPFLEV